MERFDLPSYVLSAIGKLESQGFETYAVGGCVRDLLLGKTPHDYDLATRATPDQMKEVFRGERTVETGIAHGTLTLLSEGHPLEITTFRSDGTYSDARHPDEVHFSSTMEEDAARRDFTVNAMAYHPAKGVLDYYGGKRDLELGIIRTVGDPVDRFREDALRILRAMRFAAVLDFSVLPSTSNAMRDEKELLSRVSAERVREELFKLITGKGARRILEIFADVFCVVMPEMLPTVGFAQHSPYHMYDVYRHTLAAVEAAAPDSTVRMALLLHDIGKPRHFTQDADGTGHFYGHEAESAEMAAVILDRLRTPRKTAEKITALVRYHDLPLLPEKKQIARLRSRFGDSFLRDLVAVKRADVLGQSSFCHNRLAALDEWVAALGAQAAEAPAITLKNLAVNGQDLIAAGIKPGKKMGALLEALLSAVLDGVLPNEKKDLLAALPALIKKINRTIPTETERKFLIRRPDEALLLAQKDGTVYRIEQTYLLNEEGVTERVRRRESAGKVRFFHTVKRRLNSFSAEEDEHEVDEGTYNALLLRRDPERNTIRKTRFTFPYEEHMMEVDIYPFWQKQAVLEIELETENEAYQIPPFLTLIREVTADYRYKNASLARSFLPEEAD